MAPTPLEQPVTVPLGYLGPTGETGPVIGPWKGVEQESDTVFELEFIIVKIVLKSYNICDTAWKIDLIHKVFMVRILRRNFIIKRASIEEPT